MQVCFMITFLTCNNFNIADHLSHR